MKYLPALLLILSITLSACGPSQNDIDNCVENSNYTAERCKNELSR